MVRIVFVVCICSFLVGCSSGYVDKLDTDNVERVSLHSSIIEPDSDIFIGDTNHIKIVGDKVYIYNPVGDYGLIVYDIKSRQYDYMGRKGPGPKEGILFSPHITVRDDEIVCFDISKHKFLFYDMDSIKMAKREDNVWNLNQGVKGAVIQAFSLNDSISLVTGAFERGICAYVKNGEFQSEFLEPFTADGNFIKRGLKDANMFKLSDDGRYLLRITQNGGFIGLYEIDGQGNGLKILFEKKYFPVGSKVRGENLVFTSEAKYGYINAGIDRKYVYGLYSGKELKNENFKSNIIHVYSYEGELVKILEMDRNLSAISVDASKNVLYGITAEGEKCLCVCDLQNKLY